MKVSAIPAAIESDSRAAAEDKPTSVEAARDAMARRQWRWVMALRLLFACLLGIGFLLAFEVLSLGLALFGQANQGTSASAYDIMWSFVGGLPFGDQLVELMKAARLEPVLRAIPYLSLAGLGFVVGLLALGPTACASYERYLAEFDSALLSPIRRPRPFDPLRGSLSDPGDRVMPWVMGETGPRRAAWDALRRLATERPEAKFGWTVLMGRPGSGKSRMAVEFARALARRERYGGDKGAATPWQRLATWYRVQVRCRPCGPEDPWDAGWIRPERLDPALPTERRSVRGGWLEALAGWQPRRPTLLLLDDPVPGDTLSVVEKLNARTGEFRHPVRLLVVNQTAPLDLQLLRAPEGRWQSRVLSPLVDPIVLADAGRFDASDIRALRGSGILPPNRFPISRDEQVEFFLKVTRGNPLLVELGFKWLREGKPPRDMSEDALLAERVQRIVDAFEAAGLADERAHEAIAAATIAGGAAHERSGAASGSLAGRAAIERVLGCDLGDARALRRAFPVDEVDFHAWLPPIRPELIGDAFVRAVIAPLPAHRRELLLAAAWSANARGTLRTVLRLGGRPDVLGQLLAARPPAHAGLPAGELAEVFAEAAALLPREAWNARDYDLGRDLLPTARLLIGEVDQPELPVLTDRLLAMLGTSNETAIIRRPALNQLILDALTRLAEAPHADPDRLLDLVERWLSGSPAYFGPLKLDGAQLAARAASLASGLDANAQALLRERVLLFLNRLRASLADKEVRRLSWQLIDHLLAAIQPETTVARQLAAVAEAVLGTEAGRGEPRSLRKDPGGLSKAETLWLVATWCFLAHARADDAPACQAAVERVEAMATPFAGERAFEFERAQAWCCVTFARRHDAPACQEAVERVERITAPFAGEHEFEYLKAQTWRHLAYARMNDVPTCRAAVERVETISAPFARERGFAYYTAFAWCSVAYALMYDAPACRVAVERIESITASFAGEYDFEYHKAFAWCCLVHALRHDTPACRAAVERVEALAAAFPGERDFEQEKAEAWCRLAYALRHDTPACRATVERVEALAASFAGEPKFQAKLRILRSLVKNA